MANGTERNPPRDLDTKAKNAREAVEKAKTEYLNTLTNTESSAELKELLKRDYTLFAQLAKTAAEAPLLAKWQCTSLTANPAAATAFGPPGPGSEPDDLNRDLTTVSKRLRKELKEIVRSVGSLVGGGIDKQGKFHESTCNTRNKPTV